MTSKDEKLQLFSKLLDVMDDLRAQCPWDKKQNFETLRPLTIEETYELCEALLENDLENIKKELGDVLLHLIFYAKIGSEQNAFDIGDVIQSLTEKLIYRHPHIYGNVSVKNENQVKQNWEKLKLKEGPRSVLEGVPTSLPTLVKAHRIQEKVSGVGFDFSSEQEAWNKIEEELKEFKAENLAEKREAELGDVLFSIINYARVTGLNADTALEKTNQKFRKRFEMIEKFAKDEGCEISNLSLDQMENLWERAKNLEI